MVWGWGGGNMVELMPTCGGLTVRWDNKCRAQERGAEDRSKEPKWKPMRHRTGCGASQQVETKGAKRRAWEPESPRTMIVGTGKRDWRDWRPACHVDDCGGGRQGGGEVIEPGNERTRPRGGNDGRTRCDGLGTREGAGNKMGTREGIGNVIEVRPGLGPIYRSGRNS